MFQIQGLDPDIFRPLFALSDDALAARGIRAVVADTDVGFPDRISLADARAGDRLLLMNFCYQPAETPYRGTHAIYVNEAATTPFDAIDTVPACFRPRLLSLRAFDSEHMMIDADIVEGRDVEGLIAAQFANPAVAYIQAHFAKRGCFAARIDRH
jgi:hypothetical protein